MAEREARVRLNLSAAGFTSSLKEVEKKAREFGDAVEDIGESASKASAKTSRFAQAWSTSLTAAKSSLLETGSALKGMLSQAATFGGAIGIGAALKQTTELQARYQQVAFTMERATGKAVAWAEVQSAASGAAERNARSGTEMAEAIEAVWSKTGDKGAALGSLDAIATAMNATGKSAAELGTIVGVLQKKFGMGGTELTAGLSAVIGAADRGGITLSQLSEDFDELGSIAKAAGQDGADGLQRVLGFANRVNLDVKDMSETLAGLDQLFEKLRQTPVLEGLAGAGGFKAALGDVTKTGDAMLRVRGLLEAAGGKGAGGFAKFQKQALEGEFTGREEGYAFKALADPFAAAYQEALKSGKDSKAATRAGLDAFDASLAKMAKSGTDWATLQKQSAAAMETPQAKLRAAVQAFTKSFEDPRIVRAIRDLAASLPQLAESLAKVVTWAAGNPFGAVSATLAASVVKDVTMANIKGSIEKAIAGQGSKLSLAGVVAITGAFTMGFGVGEAIANAVFDALTGKESRTIVGNVGSVASAAGESPDQVRKRLVAAQAEANRLERGPSVFSGAGVSEAFEGTMAGLAKLGSKVGLVDDPGTLTTSRSRALTDTYSTIDELRAILAEKERGGPPREDAGKTLQRPADKLSGASEKLDRAAERLERLSGAGGGRGSNGLSPAPGTSPGSEPR
jgi:hypothetical protein